MRIRDYQLTTFFVLNLMFSAAMAVTGAFLGNTNIAIITVLAPSLSAIVLTGLFAGRRGLRKLLVEQTIRIVNPKWIAVSILMIPMIACVAIGLNFLIGGSEFAIRASALFPQLLVILIIALGEEYGWRGYALPKLQEKFNALEASVILGAIWGIWHYPGYLIGTAVPLEMPFLVFMLWIVPASILITWVFNNTRSVVMAILVHVAANASFNYLPLLPEFVGQIRTFWIFLGMLWLTAITIVIVFGPRRLVRNSGFS